MTGSVALLSGENPHDVVLVLVDLFASKSSTSTVVMYFIGLGSNVQNNSKTATKFKKTQQIHVIKIWLHVIIRFWVRWFWMWRQNVAQIFFWISHQTIKYCTRGDYILQLQLRDNQKLNGFGLLSMKYHMIHLEYIFKSFSNMY